MCREACGTEWALSKLYLWSFSPNMQPSWKLTLKSEGTLVPQFTLPHPKKQRQLAPRPVPGQGVLPLQTVPVPSWAEMLAPEFLQIWSCPDSQPCFLPPPLCAGCHCWGPSPEPPEAAHRGNPLPSYRLETTECFFWNFLAFT